MDISSEVGTGFTGTVAEVVEGVVVGGFADFKGTSLASDPVAESSFFVFGGTTPEGVREELPSESTVALGGGGVERIAEGALDAEDEGDKGGGFFDNFEKRKTPRITAKNAPDT